MKKIFFSLALICATSLISNPAHTVRTAVKAVEVEQAGCAICSRCEICGKEIHDDAAQQEENAEFKCGCNKPNRSGCPICPVRCDVCGKEVHDDEDDATDVSDTDQDAAESKCGCSKPKPKK